MRSQDAGLGPFTPLALILLIALMIALLRLSYSWKAGSAAFRAVRQARRRAPRHGGQSSYLPLRVNSGGVIPRFLQVRCWRSGYRGADFGTRWPFVANIAAPSSGASRCTP